MNAKTGMNLAIVAIVAASLWTGYSLLKTVEHAKKVIRHTPAEYTELQQFAVSCFNEEGVAYEVYYLAPEQATHDEEVTMCKYPNLHSKW